MNVYVLGFLVAGGLAAHLLMKVIELRRSEASITLVSYLKAYPYTSLYSVVAAAVAGVAMYHYNELTPITAVGVGYMSDSIMDKITKRTAAAVK
jgi:hypothetical protein